MTLTGQIVAGHVVLDTPAALPDGTRVRVEPVVDGVATRPEPKEKPKTLAERWPTMADEVVDLPPDASVNVDHYLYGHPKK
jgi:hypothetical protein